MSWFRLNAMAVGSLTTTLLLGVITAYLLLAPRKGRETWFLTGYLGALFLLLLSYTLRYSVFSFAALATGQMANLIVFGGACLIQFAYWFGGNPYRAESKWLLIATLALDVIAWVTLFAPGRYPATYDFRAEYFTYDFDARVSLVTLGEYFWALMVFLRKTAAGDERVAMARISWFRRIARPAGRVARSHRSFALLTLATIPVSMQFVLLQTRLISRITYAIVFNTASLLICLLIFIIYINNAPRPTSFLVKMIGIPLSVVLVTFGIASNALMPIVERTIMERYRTEATLARLAVETRNYTRLPADAKYVVSSVGSRGTVRYLLPVAGETVTSLIEDASAGRLPLAVSSDAAPVFHYLEIRNTDSFYFSYPSTYGDTTFWVGFSYAAYRAAVHDFALKLAFGVLLACAAVVIGFPFIFRTALIRPLRALLAGVSRVAAGDFRRTVGILTDDEIGSLARGYNQMVASLQSMEGNFRALAENAYDAILIVSQEGCVLYANSRAGEMVGTSAGDLCGRELGELVPADEVVRLTERLHAHAGGARGSETYETFVRRADGRVLPVEVAAAATVWQKTRSVVVIVRDISERKQTEELLRSQQQELMRTDKLASLGELVAGVAHEINNPNQVVVMNARFLREGVPRLFSLADSAGAVDGSVSVSGRPYQDFKAACGVALEDIETSALRIDHIVGELKRFVRGKKPETEPVDLNKVVAEVVDLSRGMIKRRTAHFALEKAAATLVVRGDFVSLEQVVLNLIENACQALPDRERAVRVSTLLDAKTGEVLLRVEDEGEGIATEHVSRLTEPFFTTRSEIGGTGLGLSVTNRIVHSLNGSLHFESEPGKGTQVTVRLPRSRPQATAGHTGSVR